jgi:type IV secretory pathway TrbD component
VSALEEHVIHASLWRPILLAGAEPGFVIMEAAIVMGLLIVVGIHVVTVALAAVYATVVHAGAVWVTSQDPQISAVYLRSLVAQDYYPAVARVSARGSGIRMSMPNGR